MATNRSWADVIETGDLITDLEATNVTSTDIITDSIDATSVTIGSWTLTESGTTLYFSNGSNRLSLSSAGAVVADDDITAFGTP